MHVAHTEVEGVSMIQIQLLSILDYLRLCLLVKQYRDDIRGPTAHFPLDGTGAMFSLSESAEVLSLGPDVR